MIFKKIQYFLILVLLFSFKSHLIADENKIIIKIQNKIITSFEIKNKINTSLILRDLEINQTNINKMKRIALNELIDLRIKQIEIEKVESINLEKIDISNQLKSISSGDIDKLKNKFLVNNLDLDLFLNEIKLQVAWQKIIFSVYNSKVKIDKTEINLEVQKIVEKNIGFNEYKLSEIELNYNNNSEIEEKILEVKRNFKEFGFKKTIAQLSIAESAINKGELGWVSENALSKNIFNKLENLEINKLSEPIITPKKILFLVINEKRKANKIEIDPNKLKLDIENKRRNELFNLYSKSHLSKLKNNSLIEYK